MIGMWADGAQTFLLVFGIIGAVAFGLPIFLTPLAWARAFRWNLPDDTDLAVYFGRCLGVLALVLGAFVLRAGLTGEGMVFVFQFAIAVFVGMTLVHIWGAIRRIQPVTETIEIAFWAGLVLLGLLFYPA
ncbi:MAG TPA: hypothetical protein VM093_04835 [Aeromicrobium sp.]|nr:hypothetical protein [Aeromicrobium sp.]